MTQFMWWWWWLGLNGAPTARSYGAKICVLLCFLQIQDMSNQYAEVIEHNLQNSKPNSRVFFILPTPIGGRVYTTLNLSHLKTKPWNKYQWIALDEILRIDRFFTLSQYLIQLWQVKGEIREKKKSTSCTNFSVSSADRGMESSQAFFLMNSQPVGV